MSALAWQQWVYLGIAVMNFCCMIVLAGRQRYNWPQGGPLVIQILLNGLILWLVLSL